MQKSIPIVGVRLIARTDAWAELYACRISADIMDLMMEDFIDGVIDFMNMNNSAQVIFI